MQKKTILLLGAKSDIAIAYAQLFASKGYDLILAARGSSELLELKTKLNAEFLVQVTLKEFDVLALNTHESFFQDLAGNLYGIICCIGYLGNQELALNNSKEAQLIWNTNFIGCAHILSVAGKFLKNRNGGFIVGVSSVAGNRGRKGNYYYGSAKAGFSAFLSGLRGDLLNYNIQVVTVKPGFVKTKMTANLDLPKLLTTTPQAVANHTFKALKRKKNVVYVHWIWRYIMWIVQLIPEAIFKRTNL